MMKIKNIIFDFGEVLIGWNPRNLYRKHFETEEEMEYFLNEVCTAEWNQTLDAGLSFDEGIQQLLPLYPEYEKQIKAYKSEWEQMVTGEIIDNVSLITKLKSKYRLFGLTNWSSETFKIVRPLYSFFNDLEGIVVSGEEKIVKPDPKIYQLLFNRYNINANESLFIDDNKNNIDSANKLGLKTIHITKNTCLKSEMISLGVDL